MSFWFSITHLYSSICLKRSRKETHFFFLSHKTSFIWWQVLLLTAVSSWFRIFSIVFLRHNFCWLSLIRIFFRGFASFTEATEVGSVGGGVWSSLMVLSLINRSVQEITGVIFLNFRHTFLRNINFLSDIVFHSALWTTKCAVGAPGSKMCTVLLGERWTTVFEGSILQKRPSLPTASCRFEELSTPVLGSVVPRTHKTQ